MRIQEHRTLDVCTYTTIRANYFLLRLRGLITGSLAHSVLDSQR